MGTHRDPHITAAVPPVTAASAGLVGCRSCGQLSRVPAGIPARRFACPRCGDVLYRRKPQSLARSWALVLAALIFYIPANVLPVTYTTRLGSTKADTIFSGVVYLLNSGSWAIAVIIFLASIMVPAVKLAVLSGLLISVQRRSAWRPEVRTRLYQITEAIGRWSMVDIYVITVMVALLKLGAIAFVEAGIGVFFFGAVVVITMFAANSFDPRLIWDAMENRS
jgi:paraquat-inducible protein A